MSTQPTPDMAAGAEARAVAVRGASLTTIASHPLRAQVVDEFHMRPTPPLLTPAYIIQAVKLVPPTARAAERAFLEAALPREDERALIRSRHASARLRSGGLLMWERHSEASTLTLVQPACADDPFTAAVDNADARAWLIDSPGLAIRAVRIGVVAEEEDAALIAQAIDFEASDLVSCRVDGARIWSDFLIHEDGFGRLLIAAGNRHSSDLGRLVRRLQEIGNYRNLALLGLPLVQAEGVALGEMEAELAAITQRMGGGEPDQPLLGELTAISARVAAVDAATSFRMSATAAYAQIAQERLASLTIEALVGHQTLSDFTERRLLPAVRTCQSFQARLEVLSVRISRATSLLRTRVDVALQQQNVELLHSVNSNAARQLRLQHLVEGLSVIAVTYYGVSLLKPVAEIAADRLGVPHGLFGIGLLLAVFTLTWLYLRRAKTLAETEGHEPAPLEPIVGGTRSRQS